MTEAWDAELVELLRKMPLVEKVRDLSIAALIAANKREAELERERDEARAAADRSGRREDEWKSVYFTVTKAYKATKEMLEDAEGRIARLEEALRIIANEEQCLDNLMGDKDIARAALQGEANE
jgi:hypothetical protein